MSRQLLFLCLLVQTCAAFSQTIPGSSLLPALQKMPQQLAENTFNMIAFTDAIEAAVHDGGLDVNAVEHLVVADLKSPNLRVRKYAMLVALSLSRRLNSAAELAPILESVSTHLDDEDAGLRAGALEMLAGQRPQVPDRSISILVAKLEKSGGSDSFGADIAARLTGLRPNDADVNQVVLGYLRSPSLSSQVRAQAVLEMASPDLSATLESYIGDLLETKQDPVTTLAAVEASSRIGQRMVTHHKAALEAVESDATQALGVRQAATRALQLVQP